MGIEEEFYKQCLADPQWESEKVSHRPLRGPQAEIIRRVEEFLAEHNSGVMTIRSSRQTGKNETAATLHRRHLFRNQYATRSSIWIRTAPTYKPQIVNSKKRLRELLQADSKWRIQHPLFGGQKLIREEGYIWRLGNASVEFVSSGPNANVVGATASECLDMDEAHKVDKDKFDEDFAPFVADTGAGTILWGVAADGLDAIEWYRNRNVEEGRPELNLEFPAEVWLDVNPKYRIHFNDRVNKLGYDHPIIKTQYRLISVAAQGKFLQPNHVRALFSGDHERQLSPRSDSNYEILIDVAGGNEEFNPNNVIEGNEDTTTDSTIVWIYEVSPILASNGLFPIIRLVNLIWMTGVDLPRQEEEIKATINQWRPGKVTVDGVGIGRQIAESLESKYGAAVFEEDTWVGGMIFRYIASDSSVSEDCFDLQARLNFSSVQMFRNDGSPEWAEFERQCGWTKYSSAKGKMKLEKPDARKHIDMVKGLTYINRNRPVAGMLELYKVGGEY